MPTTPNAPLTLAAARSVAPDRVRATFSRPPLAFSPATAGDALNRLSWSVAGPGVAFVSSVVPVSGDPTSFDLILSAQLVVGFWTVSAPNVLAPGGVPMSAPTSQTFEITFVSNKEPVPQGSVNDSMVDYFRKNFNPALRGLVWNGLIAAVAAGDQWVRDTGVLVADQLHLSSASGQYLAERAADRGVPKPPNVGIGDDAFRQLAISLSANKLAEPAILGVLAAYYGEDSVRAFAQAEGPEPYAIQAGQSLSVVIDEQVTVTHVFAADEVEVPGAATAVEVTAALTRAFDAAGNAAFAAPFVDPEDGKTYVRIWSPSRGLGSSIRISGGDAQNALGFPTRLEALVSGLPTWNITFDAATATSTFTTTAVGLNLNVLRTGDYVIVSGSEFVVGNRGTFSVTAVSVSYPGGTLTQSFSSHNPSGSAQAGLAQVAAGDVTYWRSTKRTTQSVEGPPVVVASIGGQLRIKLPATSRAVQRQAPYAAYLPARAAVPVQSMVRVGQTVTVHAVAHGLTQGRQVEVFGSVASRSFPATNAGNGTSTTDASDVSIWSSLAAAPDAVYRHTALVLADGRALVVAGGTAGTSPAPSAYTKNASLFKVTSTTTLSDGSIRHGYTWTVDSPWPEGGAAVGFIAGSLLPDGRAYFSGGQTTVPVIHSSTQIYTPGVGAGAWTTGLGLIVPRSQHQHVTLNTGVVLIVGGITTGGSSVASVERHDLIGGGGISAGASMSVARSMHQAVLLSDGKVLVIGGITGAMFADPPTPTCEVYDPSGNTWTRVGSMSYARYDHSAALLPDGRVLVVGGLGHRANQPVASAALASCEIYDPTTKSWSPAGSLSIARTAPGLAVDSTTGRAYVAGGALGSSVTEFYDVTAKTWRVSTATLTQRVYNQLLRLPTGAILSTGGTIAAPTALDGLLVPASEIVGGRPLNGSFRIATVPDADHFTFTTPESGYWADVGGATVAPMASEPASAIGEFQVGPFIWDVQGSPAVTGKSSTTTAALAKGHHYASIGVVDATQFPDQPGYLCFAFGTKNQVTKVKYLGRLSTVALSLDYGFEFPADVPSGSTATLLYTLFPFIPSDPVEAGSFYLTDSPAGRVAAKASIEAVAAAGVGLDLSVEYPGDRGLGGEGRPTKGAQKLSDVVEIWAGSDVDQEVADAREGS